MTTNVFLHELRPIWPKSNPEPLDIVTEVASERGIDLAQYDLALVFSAKRIAAAVAVAHARGLFNLDDRVADYWPAFSQHGKASVTIGQLLSHQAGVAALDRKLSPKQIADREFLSTLLATKRPDWEPGTHHGYHGTTLGWYLSELIRRIDGRTLGTFLTEEVADPMDFRFHISTPEDVPDDAVAELDDFSPLALLRNVDTIPWRFVLLFFNPWSITNRVINCLDAARPSDLNRPAFRSVENRRSTDRNGPFHRRGVRRHGSRRDPPRPRPPDAGGADDAPTAAVGRSERYRAQGEDGVRHGVLETLRGLPVRDCDYCVRDARDRRVVRLRRSRRGTRLRVRPPTDWAFTSSTIPENRRSAM